MKKLALILLAICSVVFTYAQPKTILVYGNFSVNSNTQEYDGDVNVSNSMWFVNPGVGYQIDKRWTVGIQGSYGQSTAPFNNNIGQSVTTTDWTAGAFIRYTRYFGNMFSVYGQLDAGSASGSLNVSENSTDLTNSSYVGFRTSLYPAIAINIYKGLAINFNVGGVTYGNKSWTDHPSGLKTESGLDINFGHSLTIGVSKNFATQKKIHGHHEPGAETRRIDTSDDEDDDAPKAKAPKAHKEKKHKGKHAGGKKPKKSSDDDDE